MMSNVENEDCIMAKMIDIKSTYHGEAKLWECLDAYLPGNIVVYNNREINGREFDFCLLIENVGALIIEVKGWLASKINVQGVDNIIVEGFDKPQTSPKKQARAYRFALLNKIVAKYNTSPLVFDMVCYPFISKEEYISTHLNIVSEEQFTIFKEDLETKESLIQKIQTAYSYAKNIPHAEFDEELMMRLRQEWEPNFEEDVEESEIKTKPYSILSVCPKALKLNEIDKICKEYFCGIKRVVFLGDTDTYNNLITKFDDMYKQSNVQPNGNKLEIGYDKGLKAGNVETKAFNLEVYYVENLETLIEEKIDIEEGNIGGYEFIFKSVVEKTTFNFQQYMIEHSDAEKNTLVEAGAGTGKTFSMVSRVAYLCNKKIAAVSNISEEIAMVTFTNDAAINMKTRLKQMFVNYYVLTSNPSYLKHIEDIDRSHISTIHSFALNILRKEPLYTGLGTNFRIASNEFARSQFYDTYLSEFLKEMEDNNPNFIHEIPVPVYELKKKIIGFADKLLAKSIDLKTIQKAEMGVPVENTLPYFNDIIEQVIIPAEKDYTEFSHSLNDVDLKESLIVLEQTLKKMDNNLDFLKIRHLFIDEFQDTDDVQIQIFQMLQKAISAKCKLFIVGDLKQSIYRFRGARLSAFELLKQNSLYEWSVYYLMVNYRTDCRLLDAFDDVFEGMASDGYLPYSKENDRLISNVITDATDEELFYAVPCHAKDEETRLETFVQILRRQKNILEELIESRKNENKTALSQAERTIAILVRSNWQIDRIVDAAREAGLKVDVKSGGDLFQLDSTIDLFKLLLAITNCSNTVYLANFIESNYVNVKLDYSKYHILSNEECSRELMNVLDDFFEARAEKNWTQIVNEAYTQPVLYVLKQLFDILQPWKNYSMNSYEQKYYMANYEYLIERIIKYSKADTLTLNQIAEYLKVNITTRQQQLARDVDVNDDEIQLLCTTIHKSKGLEYGTVILPYTDEDISDMRKVKLEANYTQSKLSYTILFENKIRERNTNYDETSEIGEQISEESRILYVALTRAIRNCVWIKNLDSNSNISWETLLEG